MAEQLPRSSLGRILTDLGNTFLEPLCAPVGLSVPVGGVGFYDPLDDSAQPDEAIVLGIGIHEPGDIVSALTALRREGQRGAAALVVRSPVLLTDEVESAAAASGIALLGLAPGASWMQLATMIRTLIADDTVGIGESDRLGGVVSGDLFALANSITALIDVPITIEDRDSRVVAFSARQDEADSSRVETILGRQVPDRFTHAMVEQGVFRELYASDEPVWIQPEPAAPDQLPRVAVAVRAGDEVLGSIWAAVREPLSDDRLRALTDAAKLVALHMMTIRNGDDGARRLKADLVTTALRGGPGTRDALRRLGMGDRPVAVLAMDLLESDAEDDSGGDGGGREGGTGGEVGGEGGAGDLAPTRSPAAADRAAIKQRLTSGFALHISASHPRAAVALIGDVCYALVPLADGPRARRHAIDVAAEFLNRAGDGSHAVIGVGTVASRPEELATARSNADRALRVLLDRHQPGLGQIAEFDDVHMHSLLIDLKDMVAARGDEPSGPIGRLIAHDAGHNTMLVETLRAWLDAFGDIPAAAATQFVHPNTFRYRLRRAAEISGIDLSDPEARFAAMLQLRVIDVAPRATPR